MKPRKKQKIFAPYPAYPYNIILSPLKLEKICPVNMEIKKFVQYVKENQLKNNIYRYALNPETDVLNIFLESPFQYDTLATYLGIPIEGLTENIYLALHAYALDYYTIKFFEMFKKETDSKMTLKLVIYFIAHYLRIEDLCDPLSGHSQVIAKFKIKLYFIFRELKIILNTDYNNTFDYVFKIIFMFKELKSALSPFWDDRETYIIKFRRLKTWCEKYENNAPKVRKS